MSKFVEAMTVVSSHSHPSQESNNLSESSPKKSNPVVALKELVANLQREQHKIQDLLSSLGFALRSFSNLNQFLKRVIYLFLFHHLHLSCLCVPYLQKSGW